MKKILFLSALDFKEKSIQVIRKTPEAYVENGWDLDYIVARDNSETGNYFYEDEINPEGVHIHRIYWPFTKTRAKLGRYLGLLLGKLASFIVVFKLFLNAKRLLKQKQYDVVYGYELQGVLAMNLLKLFLPKEVKTVSRFQGTFLNEMFVNKQHFRLLFNLDLILAIRLHSDLLIMTNDGTQGNQAVKRIKKNKPYKMVFWTNGVDLLPDVKKAPFDYEGKTIFMSVSRLVGWKRVDRNIRIMAALKSKGINDFIYYIIGEGDQKHILETLVQEKGLKDNVIFVGALKHEEVIKHLLHTDFFLSMYDSSNVGNPLLEAIRANKLIITLNNGDTGDWIHHKHNGLIYQPDKLDFDAISDDISGLLNNPLELSNLLVNLKSTELEKLWKWSQRLNTEIKAVNKL